MRTFRLFIFTWLLIAPAAAADDLVRVRLEAASPGREFEGIGALSAGASSKLLIDYPEPQRSQILDLLFKPKYGASLQHLKVEIGGDVNSTCGTEPAFAHTREEFVRPEPQQIRRGYEWWLMREGQRRAPGLLIDALQWGAPAWIGNGAFYSQDNADYIAAFHRRSRGELSVKTAYQGIWNETNYDPEWIKLLRRTLDRAGLKDVMLGAADQSDGSLKWKIVDDAANDVELAGAIHAFGDHYTGYRSPDSARQSGKPLWATEDGPWAGDWYGATKLAKLYNRAYIDGRMTRIVTWSLITSYYDILPLPGSGLMRAVEPWSGHFEVQPGIWAAAHTTQFVEKGWRYLETACGYLPGHGSYVSLRSPGAQDFTIVVETMDSPYIYGGPGRRVEFSLDGLPDKPVHVWQSRAARQFVEIATLHPEDGVFSQSFKPESIYTLSTTTGQQKGGRDLEVPPSSVMPLPYSDHFDSNPEHSLPRHFIDQSGVFEVVSGCLRQVVPSKGIEWRHYKNLAPYSVMGDERWRDYEVEVETQFDGPGYSAVYGRVSGVTMKGEPPAGYWLSIDNSGAWELHSKSAVLESGAAGLAAQKWQRIGLRMNGDRITALLNGKVLGSIRDSSYRAGLAGIGCGWQRSWFDNFEVRKI